MCKRRPSNARCKLRPERTKPYSAGPKVLQRPRMRCREHRAARRVTRPLRLEACSAVSAGRSWASNKEPSDCLAVLCGDDGAENWAASKKELIKWARLGPIYLDGSVIMGALSIWHWFIVGGAGLFLLAVVTGGRGKGRARTYGLKTYVLKHWQVNAPPLEDGRFVEIRGRRAGVFSFFLSLVGIDPTVCLIIDRNNVRFEEGSWAGFTWTVTPLEKLCSGTYGYSRPWLASLILALLGIAVVTSTVNTITTALFLLIGSLAIAWLYYILNKALFLVLDDIGGGRPGGLVFKRSVIEGISVDEQEAARVIKIIEMLVKSEAPSSERTSVVPNMPTATQTATGTDASETQPRVQPIVVAVFCPECGAKNIDSSRFCKSCGTVLA